LISKPKRRADVIKLQNKLLVEKGPSTMQSSGRWVDWDGAEQMLGQPFDVTSIPLSKLMQMRRDPMISFALLFVKLPIIRAPWYIQCQDARIATFVDKALRRIYPRFCFQYLNSLDFGFSAIEKRFELMEPDWTYFDPNEDDDNAKERKVWTDSAIKALVWRNFTALPPGDVEPFWTRTGEFGGINYRKGPNRPDFAKGIINPNETPSKTRPDIPLEKSLWVTNEKDSEFSSLWGFPRIAYAYPYWWSYWFRMALADRHFEKDADPPMRVYYPTDVDLDEDGNEIDYAAAALALGEDLRSGGTIAIPSDLHMGLDDKPTQSRKWEVDFITQGGNFEAFTETFEYLDVMKVRSIWVPEQALMEGKGGTSSRNVAAEMGDILVESQAVLMGEIVEHINNYMIPQLVEANFGPGYDVQMVTRGFGQADMDQMKAIVQLYGQADPTSLEVDMREILSQMGVPLLNPIQLAKEKAEAERMAQQQQPPETPSFNGYAGVNQWGMYEVPREVIRLADDWIPKTDHFDSEDVRANADQMRDFFDADYGSQYEDFAQWIEKQGTHVALDELNLDSAKSAAEKLIESWIPTEQQRDDRQRRVAGWLRSIMDEAHRKEVARLRVKDADFSHHSNEVSDWADKHAAKLVRNIGETTRRELRKFLSKELAEEQDPTQIADKVRKHFRKFPGWKAERLARTEAMLAYNMSALTTMKVAGVTHARAHDAAVPERSDPHCIERDGKIFDIDQAFIETAEEHPNGTLAWSPVRRHVPVTTHLSVEVVPDLEIDGQSVPIFFDEGVIYVNEALDDWDDAEPYLAKLSEQVNLGPYARLRYAWDERKIKRDLKGRFADKPDVPKTTTAQVKPAEDPKRVEYDVRTSHLEKRVSKDVSKGTKKKGAGGKKELREGYLAGDPGRNKAGKISQKRLLEYVTNAASPRHGDVLDAPTTAQKYTIGTDADGNRIYSESRRETHEKIIEALLSDKDGKPLPSQEKPRVMFTGGGYAAGKGGLIDPEKGLLKDEVPKDAFKLDPDEIKAMLPEFDKLLETDPEANLATYEEAWDIAQAAQKRAQERKINMVVDGISDTSPEEFLARVKSFTDAGYVNPKVVYVDTPTEEALKRAKARAETSPKRADRRYIPEVIMRAVHRDVAATVPGVMEAALKMSGDSGLTVELWDNYTHHDPVKGDKYTGFTVPYKVASAKPGDKEINVEDEGLWKTFQAKADENIEGVFEKAKVGTGAVAGVAAQQAIEHFEEHKPGYKAIGEILNDDPETAVHILGHIAAAIPHIATMPPEVMSNFANVVEALFRALPLSEQKAIDEWGVFMLCEQALTQLEDE
jgi:hypothetical protein